ncbi:malate synthase G [Alkalicoccus urumqiensis]|uniref:Malate synthase G n=1 Tax=Alkalicoccus urumqiensis TaxID=1548213 RepID=A0A2P6MHE1_ALKUR|nr:malate synthase G [Alkalicoccus urumqiensis]PRO65706.1 malate synthase G [Alkalicoccus urumqiensis]
MSWTEVEGIHIHETLYQFLEQDVLPKTSMETASFWKGAAALIREMQPQIRDVLQKREELEQRVHQYHKEHPGRPDPEAYRSFLTSINYLEEAAEPQPVQTTNIDPEVAEQAAPQLVVPLSNARYALNALNARWGSLYDALYGSDIIDETEGAEKGSTYNPARGARVTAYAKKLLDQWFPLEEGSHAEVSAYTRKENELVVTLEGGNETALQEPERFIGSSGEDTFYFLHHKLHTAIHIDRSHPVGRADPAGIKDIEMEAALTVIMDAEDSVAAVDADDKCTVYRNWLGLMEGTLRADMEKGGRTVTREPAPDKIYRNKAGGESRLRGRALQLIRNVGHLMTTDMILDENREPVSEGLVDGLVTALIGSLDHRQNRPNSPAGSIYIVKPKMHGPAEAALTDTLFSRIEELLGLPAYTIKVGVMDEEKRTSLQLRGAIQAVRRRIFFINTGFLDRTGDEIHTAFYAGPMIRKQEMKDAPWLAAYETANVEAGMEVLLHQRGQIGKGMWAMPDEMKQMLEQKQSQLRAGGSTAWVPSPTAAVIHAIHYHEVDMDDVYESLPPAAPEKMLIVPVEENPSWTDEEIQMELETNAQAILGYVVRWVDQGIGCSKVPNREGTALMEDRATLRIASQHMANWLYHGICSENDVHEVMRRMAALVDEQNAGDPAYRPIHPDLETHPAYQAALELVLEGHRQPNGYTEPILHRKRREVKEAQKQHS